MGNKTALFLRWGVLVLALAMTVIGWRRGEHLEVLGKAVRVCLECVGIG